MERNTRQLSRGYAALFASIAIWSMPSLFQFYLVRYYEPFAQNFYRYSVACLAIAPFVFYRVRRGGPKIDIYALGLCLIPCIPNVIHQITQVVSLFYMGPGVYAIFNRSSVIFTALLALAFFPEERHIIRQWQFQLGTLLGLFGAFGVIWFQAGNGAFAAANPSGVVYRSQMADQKKPPQVVDKIVEGKLEKFFSEQCLLEQPFIKDASGKTKVKDLMDRVNAATKEKIGVRRFARFQVGGGG